MEEEFNNLLQLLFLKNNRDKFDQIVRALEAEDIELAHRLAHTLKSNAGQIGRTRLQSAAADVERCLKDGKKAVTEDQLRLLDAELAEVLDELSFLHGESAPETGKSDLPALSAEKIRELAEKLEILLESGNPECLQYVSELRAIPESEQLIQQMEDYEFESARSMLAELKKKYC